MSIKQIKYILSGSKGEDGFWVLFFLFVCLLSWIYISKDGQKGSGFL